MKNISKNLYDVLGVDKDAPVEEIKKKYRKLAKKHRPNKGGDNNTFSLNSIAFDTLTDKAKRERYERTGNTDIPNYKKLAYQNLATLFQQLIAQNITAAPFTVNYIDAMKKATCNIIEKISNEIKKRKSAIKTMELLSKRFESKDDVNMAADLLERMVQNEEKCYS